MTPDELRKGAEVWSHEWLAEKAVAAADAWEMDRIFLRQTGERLEATEKAAKNYRNCADNYLMLSDPFDKLEATHRREYDRWLGKLDAALAGEETK